MPARPRASGDSPGRRAAEADRPGAGAELAGEQIDQRRLAGAVRADDGVDLADVDVERDLGDGA